MAFTRMFVEAELVGVVEDLLASLFSLVSTSSSVASGWRLDGQFMISVGLMDANED